MPRFPFFTAALVLSAILAPFFFPWGVSLAIGIIAAFYFAPASILSGVLIDTLYFNTHIFPYFTILGAVISVLMYFVQQFVKTRIMS